MTKADSSKNQLRCFGTCSARTLSRSCRPQRSRRSFRNDNVDDRGSVRFQTDNNCATHPGREFHSPSRCLKPKARTKAGAFIFLPRCVSLAWIRVDTRAPGKLFYEEPVRSQISAALLLLSPCLRPRDWLWVFIDFCFLSLFFLIPRVATQVIYRSWCPKYMIKPAKIEAVFNVQMIIFVPL